MENELKKESAKFANVFPYGETGIFPGEEVTPSPESLALEKAALSHIENERTRWLTRSNGNRAVLRAFIARDTHPREFGATASSLRKVVCTEHGSRAVRPRKAVPNVTTKIYVIDEGRSAIYVTSIGSKPYAFEQSIPQRSITMLFTENAFATVPPGTMTLTKAHSRL